MGEMSITRAIETARDNTFMDYCYQNDTWQVYSFNPVTRRSSPQEICHSYNQARRRAKILRVELALRLMGFIGIEWQLVEFTKKGQRSFEGMVRETIKFSENR